MSFFFKKKIIHFSILIFLLSHPPWIFPFSNNFICQVNDSHLLIYVFTFAPRSATSIHRFGVSNATPFCITIWHHMDIIYRHCRVCKIYVPRRPQCFSPIIVPQPRAKSSHTLHLYLCILHRCKILSFLFIKFYLFW